LNSRQSFSHTAVSSQPLNVSLKEAMLFFAHLADGNDYHYGANIGSSLVRHATCVVEYKLIIVNRRMELGKMKDIHI
jgi:hypothetical protein